MVIIDLACFKRKEEIPRNLIKKHSSMFPQAYFELEPMSLLSKEIASLNKNVFCSVPFCNTVEAEAFGAIINYGDGNLEPRIKKYRYKHIFELKELKDINFEMGRIKEVLDCVKLLKVDGWQVLLKVVGPITILSSIIEMKTLVKGFKNNEPILYQALETIERNLDAYISIAAKSGARIISYADPTGNINIVGPNFYKNVCAKANFRVLKRLIDSKKDSVIHVCKVQSLALDELGLVEVEKIKSPDGLNYCEAMIDLADRNNAVMFGQKCLNAYSSKHVEHLDSIVIAK
ncbi:uroporphyrinogen decarboxylase family protein [Proteinivorax tanatarense]|uniref:Uroporphyrinogen decarboxylase family protein n=1 Tax=Proteinivorax tanatarense TaxID=1260629 RepID=A0AAU7VHH9_9FIRM